jgi:glutathione S-transferase
MPVNPNAPVRISAFCWVPPFARGFVRDLRVRWALEEAGVEYSVRLFDARKERPADYYDEQPFGQVPTYVTPDITLFETGAIVLHIAAECETLLPADPAARARATAWVFAALNSIEPQAQQLAAIEIFHAGEDWTHARRPQVVDMVRKRLGRLDHWLGDRQWLEDRFTVGDLMMTTVLRDIDLVGDYPLLAAYRARGEARPAFLRALDAQMSAFQ